ncbi:hypothetical protein [Schumannella soli]|uniref:hypothetical protein n=1 Tax=Schumannella soli TaxID=2590779 RepID=UPI0015E84CAC|nr:hypothetical protein [Schumannella soli]
MFSRQRRHRMRRPAPRRIAAAPPPLETRETPVLDLVFVIGVIAVFALIALLGKAVEKL